MNLIQAQDRYISTVNSCHPGHRPRVSRGATRRLREWLEKRGYDAQAIPAIVQDARDVARLERDCED